MFPWGFGTSALKKAPVPPTLFDRGAVPPKSVLWVFIILIRNREEGGTPTRDM